MFFENNDYLARDFFNVWKYRRDNSSRNESKRPLEKYICKPIEHTHTHLRDSLRVIDAFRCRMIAIVLRDNRIIEN